MSIAAMAWAKWQITGDSSTKLVLLTLADYAHPNPDHGPQSKTADGRHYTWSHQNEVAEVAEMSLSTVKRHETRLVKLGLIRKEKRFSKSGSRLSDIIILAVDSRGPRPFPDAAEPAPAEVVETKCQDELLFPPAETTKCQDDLRSPATLGPSVIGDPYIRKTPSLDGKNSLSVGVDKTPPSGQRESSTEPRKPAKTSDRSQVEVLVEAALERFPAWGRSQTRKAITAELADGRTFEVVSIAWGLFLADPQTRTPGRFKYPMGWWTTAAGTPTPRPAIPAQTPGEEATGCRTDRCVNGWVSCGERGEHTLACPTCLPVVHAKQLASARGKGHEVATFDDLVKTFGASLASV